MEDVTIVGYERPESWAFDEVAWRYCLACYRPSQDTPSIPLTRQRVEAECQALHEQGVAHNGPHRDWHGLKEDRCWICGKNLLTGKRPRKRQIDELIVAQRIPYQLRHILVQNPELLTNTYPDMTEIERLEVLAYVTRQQRSKRSYQDMSEAERLAAAETLLQRWEAWSGEIDGSHDWRFPPKAWKALVKLARDTSSLLEQRAAPKEE